jgi:tetratricopeptide (TPR) repeat protein
MFQSLIGLFFTSRSAKLSRKRNKRANNGPERVSASTFAPSGQEGFSANPKILLATLGDDSSGQMTEMIANCLSRSEAFDVFRDKRTLKLASQGTLVDQLFAAFEQGRDWLSTANADLLIWGKVEESVATIRFIPAVPVSDSQPGAFGMGDVLYLPATLDDGLESALTVSAIAAIGTGYRGARGRLGQTLKKYLQGVKLFINEKPDAINDEHYASLLTCIGNGFAVHAGLGGSPKRLDQAAATYKIAVKHVNAENSVVIWALAQSHLAAALRAVGDKEKDQDKLKQAAKVYNQITETLSRIAQPFDWALAQVNQGLVLYRIGALAGRAAYFQESSKSFEEALSVYKKDTMPGKWAEVTNQYGVVLMALGELVTGNVALEMAVKQFRLALGVRKRDRAPLLWAQTANNLGAACFSLAKRNSEVALLREAMSCFDGAVEIYQEAGDARKADVISNNLSRVHRLLSAREG